jgi:hypothetical protein
MIILKSVLIPRNPELWRKEGLGDNERTFYTPGASTALFRKSRHNSKSSPQRPIGEYLDHGVLADDAVRVGPVSTTKFPANREIYREFCGFGHNAAIEVSIQAVTSMACSQIPY